MYGICGKGEMEDTLKEAIVTYHLENVVKLLGYRKDIDEICQCADIFVFPSLQEGLPLALMEAMATGLPCVVSHIRGNADLIEQGKGGYLCDPKRPEEFIDAIEKLIDNSELRAEMGAVNQETIKHYDLASIHNEMLQLYSEKELMNIGGGGPPYNNLTVFIAPTTWYQPKGYHVPFCRRVEQE
jgi:glycosyltransferase involved in cell wall biosynthesis